MPRLTKNRSSPPNPRKRRESTKDSHQNPTFYVDRGSQASRYDPLDPDQDEIRLLRVKPSSQPDEPIECELFHTCLSSAPRYCALSYAWGVRSQPSKVRVDSKDCAVTPNLKNALLRLRPRDGKDDMIIWADALCINQNDIPERNLQTGKMRKIYQNADNVAVWLGPKHHGSDLALQLARDLNRCRKEEIPSIIRDPLNAEAFDALVVLFRRQYWWRIWVVQEVSCAKDCTAYCGPDSISWSELENVCDVLKEHEDQLQDIYYSRLSYIRTLTHGGPKSLLVSRYSPKGSAPPLHELLLSHKSKKATDPKDKVYALVGISSCRESFGEIDYSQSMREVFSHTARHIIATSKKLEVICVKPHDINQFDLPTWVPDWTRPPGGGQAVIGLQHHQPPFSAGGDDLAQATFLRNGYVLKTSGLVIDHIKVTGLPFKKRGPPGDILPVLHAFDDWWKIFVESKGDTRDSRVTFIRCISCGNWIFDSDKSYIDKLQSIFDLSNSGRAIKYSANGAPPPETEDPKLERNGTPEEEKTQVATVLSASLTMNRRTLFISDEIVGLAPWGAEPGDLVCVLPGCKFPVVLRKQESHFILIGEAYVDSFMHGEGMGELRDGKFQLETFEIH
jgi:hypothetical protein